jgi:protein-tyrosine-phosphatase
VKKVLFVCTANSYGSLMAQAIFDTQPEDEGLRFRAGGARAPKRSKGRPWLRMQWQLWRRRGSTRGSTAYSGERGDGQGGRVVLAMDPRQTVALDLLEGDSSLGIRTLPEYTTGVAGEGIPEAYGLTIAAYRSTLP